MKMNLNQTKLVGLTMELELKTREYKKLCNQLEDLKKKQIDENAEELLELKDQFQKNYNEIAEINKELKQIKENELLKEKELSQHFDSSKLFEKRNKTNINQEETSIVVKKNENIFIKILRKIKSIFQ